MPVQPQPIRPDPDPTVMTTAQLERAITNLDALNIARIEIIDARLNAMDKAVELLQTFPTAIDVAISHLKELHDEKFRGISTQFKERDIRIDQRALDTKMAVDAAFAAAKETFGKSETGFAEQIKGLTTIVNEKAKSADDKLGDVKDRLTAIESRSKGTGEAWGWVFAAISLLIALAAVFLKR